MLNSGHNKSVWIHILSVHLCADSKERGRRTSGLKKSQEDKGGDWGSERAEDQKEGGGGAESLEMVGNCCPFHPALTCPPHFWLVLFSRVAVFVRWEEEKYESGVKWKFLEHNGPYFPPEYQPFPDNVNFYYDGQFGWVRFSLLSTYFVILNLFFFFQNLSKFLITQNQLWTTCVNIWMNFGWNYAYFKYFYWRNLGNKCRVYSSCNVEGKLNPCFISGLKQIHCSKGSRVSAFILSGCFQLLVWASQPEVK